MKRASILAFLMLISLSMSAQSRAERKKINKNQLIDMHSVTVYYDVSSNFVRLDTISDAAPEMSEKTAKYVMHFSNNKYGYAPIESLNDKKQLNIYGPKAVYIAHKEMIACEQMALKYVMVREPIRSLKWKITKERDIVCGYPCIKAVVGDTVAWFCEKLKEPLGPMGFIGLPGLVLKIELPRLVCVATQVEPNAARLSVVYPRNLPIYSRQEFKKQRKSRKLFRLDDDDNLKLNKPTHGDVLPDRK